MSGVPPTVPHPYRAAGTGGPCAELGGHRSTWPLKSKPRVRRASPTRQAGVVGANQGRVPILSPHCRRVTQHALGAVRLQHSLYRGHFHRPPPSNRKISASAQLFNRQAYRWIALRPISRRPTEANRKRQTNISS